jgi:hypothetical protein
VTTKPFVEAGYELNHLVATKVVGTKLVKGIWAYWRHAPELWEAYDPKVHRQYLAGTEENLPLVYQHDENFLSPHPLPYSTDLACALRVVDFMRKDGFSFKLWQPSAEIGSDLTIVSFVCGHGPCEKHGNPRHNHHGAYDVEAETLPVAVCVAAVMAKLKNLAGELTVVSEA